MSLDILTTGKLTKPPMRRTGQGGKTYATATMRAATEDGDILVNLIAFGAIADSLLALGAGDSLAVTGRAKVSTWTGKDGTLKTGLSVTAEAIMSLYQARKRRQAMAGD